MSRRVSRTTLNLYCFRCRFQIVKYAYCDTWYTMCTQIMPYSTTNLFMNKIVNECVCVRVLCVHTAYTRALELALTYFCRLILTMGRNISIVQRFFFSFFVSFAIAQHSVVFVILNISCCCCCY